MTILLPVQYSTLDTHKGVIKKTGDKTRYCCFTTRTNPSVGQIGPQKSRDSAHRNGNSKAHIQTSVGSFFSVQEVYAHSGHSPL